MRPYFGVSCLVLRALNSACTPHPTTTSRHMNHTAHPLPRNYTSCLINRTKPADPFQIAGTDRSPRIFEHHTRRLPLVREQDAAVCHAAGQSYQHCPLLPLLWALS